jgi:hypothetical protein
MEKILQYITALDWTYMLTLILMASILTQDVMVNWMPGKMAVTIKGVNKAFRVFFLGLVYAAALYYLRGYTGRTQIENLFSSLVFAMVFFELICKSFFSLVNSWVNKTIEG